MITSINPATGAEIATFEEHTEAEVNQILDQVVAAQAKWRKTPLKERIALLNRLAEQLENNADHHASIITQEMGKPVGEAQAEVAKCAKTLRYYAEHAADVLAPEEIKSDAAYSGLRYDPLGVVLAIMPWNYPYWQFFRFVAPALAAGNGAILKHAANVPMAAHEFPEIFRAAGAPEGLFATLMISSRDVEKVIKDERVAAVTFTGSTQVGEIIASQAGSVLKKQVLELGGSDPFIVLEDADVDAAAAAAVKGRFTNNGQSCVNSKRFIVADAVADEFVQKFADAVNALTVGDPTDPATDLGPMARANLRDDIHQQVQKTLEEGGKLITGGSIIEGDGFYYQPTIIDRVTPEHTAFKEETFGPVAAIVRFSTVEEAIELANATEFGLGASLWTKSRETAEELVPQIDAGAVFVNSIVASDPRLPFGGIKKSGYGRELGTLGMREFMNIKTVSFGV